MMRVGFIFLAVFLAGCVTPPPAITDWRPHQERYYDGVSNAAFEAALQTTFNFSRPGEYALRIMPSELVAERNFMQYLVIAAVTGVETWSVRWASSEGGVKVVADATSNSISTGGYVSTHMQGRPRYPAQYEILWARLDYMLGQRADWPMCKTFPGTDDVSEDFIGFCSAFWKDAKTPPAAIIPYKPPSPAS